MDWKCTLPSVRAIKPYQFTCICNVANIVLGCGQVDQACEYYPGKKAFKDVGRRMRWHTFYHNNEIKLKTRIHRKTP